MLPPLSATQKALWQEIGLRLSSYLQPEVKTQEASSASCGAAAGTVRIPESAPVSEEIRAVASAPVEAKPLIAISVPVAEETLIAAEIPVTVVEALLVEEVPLAAVEIPAVETPLTVQAASILEFPILEEPVAIESLVASELPVEVETPAATVDLPVAEEAPSVLETSAPATIIDIPEALFREASQAAIESHGPPEILESVAIVAEAAPESRPSPAPTPRELRTLSAGAFFQTAAWHNAGSTPLPAVTKKELVFPIVPAQPAAIPLPDISAEAFFSTQASWKSRRRADYSGGEVPLTDMLAAATLSALHAARKISQSRSGEEDEPPANAQQFFRSMTWNRSTPALQETV